MTTKKVKHAGRFGVRYGKRIRDLVVKVEEKQRQKHICPFCGAKKVKRISTGIYECKKCGAKFAGGAYVPETMTGTIVKKMVKQKKFMPMLQEVLEANEEKGVESIAEVEKNV